MYSKIPFPSAVKITEHYQPSEDVSKHLVDNPTPQKLISRLEQDQNYSDLVLFLAHALPPREGIGWALSCNKEISDQRAPYETRALAAAQAWCINPCEQNRRHAEKAAQKAKLQTAPGWVAQAVFWSGGSMTAPDTPVVPPPPWLYCQAVAGAVNLAAILPDGQKAAQLYPVFIQKALSIAQGNS